MADNRSMLDALENWNSDRFKSVQRKLTSAKNTIDSEALSWQLMPFLTEDEINTLRNASKYLGGFKTRIEHAKEKKKRLEKNHERQCELARRRVVASFEQMLLEMPVARKLMIADLQGFYCNGLRGQDGMIAHLETHGLDNFKSAITNNARYYIDRESAEIGRKAVRKKWADNVSPERIRAHIDSDLRCLGIAEPTAKLMSTLAEAEATSKFVRKIKAGLVSESK